MKAIFVTGGKQYLVTEGYTVYVEKLDVEEGKTVKFYNVLMVDGVVVTPNVEVAKVVGEVERQGKQKKINVFHYTPKKKFRKTQGHRQPYTKIIIKKIVK